MNDNELDELDIPDPTQSPMMMDEGLERLHIIREIGERLHTNLPNRINEITDLTGQQIVIQSQMLAMDSMLSALFDMDFNLYQKVIEDFNRLKLSDKRQSRGEQLTVIRALNGGGEFGEDRSENYKNRSWIRRRIDGFSSMMQGE